MKITTKAIIGFVTGSDPITYRGRLVLNDGENVGKILDRACPSVFPDVSSLMDFVFAYHWVGLTRCDLRQKPISQQEYSDNPIKNVHRPAVYMGERIYIIGNEGPVEWITQDHNTWFADYLHLLYVPSLKLATYQKNPDTGAYVETLAVDLKFTDRTLPWEVSPQTPEGNSAQR